MYSKLFQLLLLKTHIILGGYFKIAAFFKHGEPNRHRPAVRGHRRPEVHRAIQAAGAVRQHQRADRVRPRGAGKPAAHGGNDPGG